MGHDLADGIDDSGLIGLGERGVERDEERSRGHLLGDGERDRTEPVPIEWLEMDRRDATPAGDAAFDEGAKDAVAIAAALAGETDAVRLKRVVGVSRPRRH